MTVTIDETTAESTDNAPAPTVAVQRQMPWSRFGTDVSKAMTAKEAMVSAGLDWGIELQPVFRSRSIAKIDENGVTRMVPDREHLVEVPNRFAVVRDDTDRELSIVSERYKTFGNSQAFEFMDSLVESGSAQFNSALSVRDGRSVALSMVLNDEPIKVAGEDPIDLYLILRTSHDGSSRIRVDVAPVRLFCTNQSGLITRTAKSSWGITHTANVAEKIKEAQDSLLLGRNYGAALINEVADPLAAAHVSDDHFVAQLKMVLPERPKRDDEIQAILNTFQHSDNIGNFRNTGWGAVNAFTEWSEHVRANRSPEALFGRVLDGTDMKIRNALSQRILAAA